MTNRRTMLLVTGVCIAAAGTGFLAARLIPSPAPTAAAPATAEAPLPTEVTLTPEAARNFGLRTAQAEQRPLQLAVRVTGTASFNKLRLAHINPLAGHPGPGNVWHYEGRRATGPHPVRRLGMRQPQQHHCPAWSGGPADHRGLL